MMLTFCQLAFGQEGSDVRPSRLSPRKAPRQDRSKATVEAILEATADILVRDGHARLTSNRIADRAGVNIASLYQFFPGKEAIVAELSRRHVADQRRAMRLVFLAHRGAGLEAMVRTMVLASIAAHPCAPKLHHALTEMMPARRGDQLEKDDAAFCQEMRAVLAETDVRNVDLAQWMISTAGHAVVHRGIVERPEDVRSGLLAEELITLIVRYLRR